MEKSSEELYFRFVEEKGREGRDWEVGIGEVWS